MSTLTLNECEAWILWFSDIDREQVHFHGHGAKEAALKAYEHAKMAWTCRLYHCVAHSGYGPETAHDSVTHETFVRPPHWHCRTHGNFDAMVAVGCPECMRLARQALIQIQRETWASPWEAGQAAHKLASDALDPSTSEKASEPREWRFERYRNGRLMAEGVTVHTVTEAEAWEKAESLKRQFQSPTDELRLSQSEGDHRG